MINRVFITPKDIADIGYFFLDAEHERKFLRQINIELMGIMTEEEALKVKQRTLDSLKEKRLVVLLKSAEKIYGNTATDINFPSQKNRERRYVQHKNKRNKKHKKHSGGQSHESEQH